MAERGRPSKYDPSHCDVVVELGKQGKSLAQMCAHFDIARSTIDKWAEDHTEFSEALSRAKVHSQAWWEETGVAGMTADKFNSQIWVKTVQARFREDYTERQEVTGANGAPLITEQDPRQLARAITALLSEAAIEPEESK